MKKCPKCGREYDSSMMFCLDDGAELLYGPASVDEPATAILSDAARPADESPTRAQIHTTASAADPLTHSAPETEQQSFSANRAAEPQGRSGLDKRVLAGVVLLIVIAGAGFFGYRYLLSDSGEIRSIAVLPFENRSGHADADYLSDGLAESLIYRLTQLPGLKVSPTNSVLRFKGSQSDIATIARELEVDAVMSGRLTQRGEDLSISVELTDARTKKLIWAEQYARKMSDLLATQREIATTVTQKLQLKLSGDQTKGLTKQYTNDNEAYQLYLKGRFYWNKRTEAGLKAAIENFKAASEKDPSFALAYVGLADSHLVGLYSTRGSEQEQIALGKAYARKALDIDESLAEAHASLGLANTYSWNWVEAENSFRQAIDLNPNYPSARHWYSRLLRAQGRTDEALEQILRARQSDELSAVISNNLAESLHAKGDAKGAIEECKRGIELGALWPLYRTLAYAHFSLGQKEEALANALKVTDPMNGAPGVRVRQVEGFIQAAMGDRSEALTIARVIEDEVEKGRADGRDVAIVYAGLGDNDKVFEWLEKDFQRRSTSLVELRMEVPFVPLHNDARFKDLLRRMGLSD